MHGVYESIVTSHSKIAEADEPFHVEVGGSPSRSGLQELSSAPVQRASTAGSTLPPLGGNLLFTGLSDAVEFALQRHGAEPIQP